MSNLVHRPSGKGFPKGLERLAPERADEQAAVDEEIDRIGHVGAALMLSCPF
jgi:hypothetical protein